MFAKNKYRVISVLIFILLLTTSCEKKDNVILDDTKDLDKELNVLVENLKDHEYIEFISKAYQELNPEIKVNVTKTEDFQKSLDNKDNLFDLLFYKPYGKNYDFLKTNVGFEDISSLDEYNEIFTNGNIKEMVNENGKYFIFPVTGDVQGIIINKKLFENNELNIPVTVDDLTYISNKIKEKQLYPFQFYITPSEKFLELHLALMGVSDTSLENFVIELSEDGGSSKSDVINDYTKLVNLIFDNIDYSMINFEYEQGLNDFASDRSFMLPGSCEDLLTLLYINPEMNLDIIPFPSSNKSLSIEILRGFSIVENSVNKDTSVDFLKFVNQKDTAQYYINKTGNISLLANGISEINEFKNINTKVFEYNLFVNFNNSIDDAIRINLRDNILKYINSRDVGVLTSELEKTLQYINNDFKTKERF